MSIQIRLKLDEQAFRRMNAPSGDIGRAVQRAAGKARDDAKRIITDENRVDTGALRQSVVSEEVRTTPGGVYWQIGSALPYAIFQHEGIGPVVPRRAKVLRFKPKGGGSVIFRPRTKGFGGIHFLTRALQNLRANDFQP